MLANFLHSCYLNNGLTPSISWKFPGWPCSGIHIQTRFRSYTGQRYLSGLCFEQREHAPLLEAELDAKVESDMETEIRGKWK